MPFLIFICIYGMQYFKYHLMIYVYFLVCRYGVVVIVYICCVDFGAFNSLILCVSYCSFLIRDLVRNADLCVSVIGISFYSFCCLYFHFLYRL